MAKQIFANYGNFEDYDGDYSKPAEKEAFQKFIGCAKTKHDKKATMMFDKEKLTLGEDSHKFLHSF